MPPTSEARTTTKSAPARNWTVSDDSPVAQLVTDGSGAVRAVNTAALELLGTVAEYLPGDPSNMVGEPIDVLPFVSVADDAGTTVHAVGDRRLQVTVVPQAAGHLVLLSDISALVAEQDELMKLREMLEQVPTNVMVVDLDLNLTYLNKKSIASLTTLQEYLPVPVSELIGTSIDIFHKNPAHQRGLLGSASNLPHTAIIQLGPEKMELQVSPIRNASGEYVAAMASWDIVTQRLEYESNFKGQLDAISKAQAVIEFELDGTVIVANENFQNALGYTLQEIQGHHHRMFVDPAESATPEYTAFWNALRAGEYQAGEFKRRTKQGTDIWIQASYNPIYDPDGKVYKVVKYATDITPTVESRQRLETGVREMLSVVEQLVGSSAQLSDVSQEMGATAEESSAQANVVAAAAEQVSANVSTVASATEEMTASIREIAANSTNAASVAGRAVEVAQDTNATAAKLGESSAEIGQIVKVITSIAQQTNLLALNATIEAARAGEVGKGFAVVANEVKELAKATARATEDISQKIETIQTDTGSVVSAIDDISEIIGQISDIQSTIASAVEEQAATTSEIGRNVTEAARGSSEIAENITSVAEAAASTSTGAAQTSMSATEMSGIADRLRELINGLAG